MDEEAIARFEAALKEDKNLARRAKYLAIFRLMVRAGLGASEIVNLQLQDIDCKAMILFAGKGNKRREVPIDSQLKAALETYLEFIRNEQEFVFENRKGGAITARSIQSRFSRVAAKAGVQIRPRELSEFFYRRLGENGVRPEIIAYLKGNSSLDTVVPHLPQVTREQVVAAINMVQKK